MASIFPSSGSIAFKSSALELACSMQDPYKSPIFCSFGVRAVPGASLASRSWRRTVRFHSASLLKEPQAA
jgi:hypothetical protein